MNKPFEESIKDIAGLRVTAIHECREVHTDDGPVRRSQAVGFIIMVHEDIIDDYGDVLSVGLDLKGRPLRVLDPDLPLEKAGDELARFVAEAVATRLVEAGIEEVGDLYLHLNVPEYERQTWIAFIEEGRRKLAASAS